MEGGEDGGAPGRQGSCGWVDAGGVWSKGKRVGRWAAVGGGAEVGSGLGDG